jgi:DNA polymerase-3 subunit gamma/tau
MSYQVLARKWRPRFFDEMVGQEHVLRALINALNEGRLHHAYLFSGTRGVGKTTIARILAKCLNCEEGISARPCGVCGSCKEIAEGRFVDLIEVDAASRTRVEDTRELLDNVQYAPTRGRFKVYLIDEVHMLSSHSFNALLKTLEEPPAHVKFLLATTDPQKLPVTILSRCLQFSLKNMTPERIVEYLARVLDAEKLQYEEPALWSLGRAAQGSMRDALSLTDQAIAYGEGIVGEEQVNAMLGTMDRGRLFKMAEVMAKANAAEVMNEVAAMAEHGPDFDEVLQGLLHIWHRAALAQVVPDAIENSQGDRDAIVQLGMAMQPEDLQLYYQIALQGRKDLAIAPEPRQGFEMVLLRMLAFRPAPDVVPELDLVGALQVTTEKKKILTQPSDLPNAEQSSAPVADLIVNKKPVAGGMATSLMDASAAPVAAAAIPLAEQRATMTAVENLHAGVIEQGELPELQPHTWWQWVDRLKLAGLPMVIARSSALVRIVNGVLHFDVDPEQGALFNESQRLRIQDALRALIADVHIEMTLVAPRGETPEQRRQRLHAESFYAAKQAIESDPVVNHIVSEMGGVVVEETIRPVS